MHSAPAGQVTILTGATGTGKTHGVHHLANDHGLRVFELNSCDANAPPEAVVQDVRCGRHAALAVDEDGHATHGGRPLVLLDDIDAYPELVVDAIARYLEKPDPGAAPLVCTCDPNSPAFRRLRAHAQMVIQLYPIHEAALAQFQLAKKWRNSLGERAIWHFARLANGDIRQFQMRIRLACSLNARPSTVDGRSGNIFRLTSALFAHPTLDYGARAPIALAVHEDPGIMLEMVFENYPRALDDLEEMARASDAYAQADTMRNPMHFHLLQEASALALGAVRKHQPRDVNFAESRRKARAQPQEESIALSWKRERCPSIGVLD